MIKIQTSFAFLRVVSDAPKWMLRDRTADNSGANPNIPIKENAARLYTISMLSCWL